MASCRATRSIGCPEGFDRRAFSLRRSTWRTSCWSVSSCRSFKTTISWRGRSPCVKPDSPRPADGRAAVTTERQGAVTTVILSRPERRNAVDRPTAQALARAFRAFERDPEARVAVLWGAGGTFCAGADLKAIAAGTARLPLTYGDGPLGPTRLRLGKPVIAGVAGHAVAGGLELALW